MTSAEVVYLVSVAIYVVFFLLFARFFVWKRYADRRYWHRRPPLSLERVRELAHRRGVELPYFSVIVPARNEAEVIGRTIDHLLGLEYDPTRFEIVVVSDEKELRAREARRPAVLAGVQARLDGGAAPGGPPGPEDRVILGLLARQAVAEYVAGRREYRRLMVHLCHNLGEPELAGALPRHVVAVTAVAERLVRSSRRLRVVEVRLGARLATQSSDPHETELAAAVHTTLAVPVTLAYVRLTGRSEVGTPGDVVRRTGRPLPESTALVVAQIAEMLAQGLAARLESERVSGRLRHLAGEVFTLLFPTTQDVVEERIAALAAVAATSQAALQARPPALAATATAGVLPTGVSAAPRTRAAAVPVSQPARSAPEALVFPRVRHVVVPVDFDGGFPGRCIGRDVPSTKGRALNWALSFTDPRSEAYGFYDAESRPDRQVLLYVASRRLSGDPSAALLQGPAFQVRNFFRLSPLCKVACLYQAIAHDWYLPALFRRLPFVGGTNLFIDRTLLERAGGFDAGSLTEDLELGVRTYLRCGAWPEFLPYPSSEQTPPTLAGFFRQRLRWGSGHLQVMDKTRQSPDGRRAEGRRILRTLWLKGQFEWVLYQTATFIPPTVLVCSLTGNVDPTVLPAGVRLVLALASLVYPCFTFYAYYRYYRFIDPLDRSPGAGRQALVCLELLVLPLAAFCFPVPYTAALILKALGREPRSWVKTPRTAE
ncbi:MAG: glycosyltransferase [Firmicutes bacterium]|nr:glycosyltransferase [Bacillota bacterium]